MTPLLTINRNILKPVLRQAVRTLCWITAGIVMASSGSVFAELSMPLPPKTKKKNAPPLPPQAVPVAIKVDPGGTVQIPLKVYGRQWRGMRYLIRSEPKLGKIVSLTPTDKEAVWLLTYRHTSAMTEGGDLRDRILFVAQDDDGTSAPTEIAITVADAPARLVAPPFVDFGKIPAGVPAVRHFILANEGGQIVEGEIAVEGPFTLEPTDYRLARGEKAGFRLRFHPEAVQDYRGALRIPGIENPVALRADAFAPIAVEPGVLELTPNPADLVRSGTLTVTNQTDQEQTVGLAADARLNLPEKIVLGAGEVKVLPVALGEGDVAALEGALRFSAAHLTQSVPVTAAAVGPRLRSQPEEVAFGSVETGRNHERRVRVQNWGGAAASIVAYAPPPFEVNPAKFDLEPGKEIDLVVEISPGWPGLLASNLKLQSGDLVLSLPISGEVVNRAERPKAVLPKVPAQRITEPVAAAAAPVTTDPLFRIEVKRIGSSHADLAWPPSRHGKNRKTGEADRIHYRLEARSIAMDPAGSARISWVPMPGTTLEPQDEKITARVANLPKGFVVMVRVVAMNPKEEVLEMSPPITLSIPIKRPFFTGQRLLLAGFGLLLGGALWLRSGRAIFGVRIR